MKNKIAVFLVLVICFCALQNVFGQDADKELTELRSKWYKLKDKESYRQKTTFEVFEAESKTLKKKIVSIYEFVPPDRSYYSSTVEEKGMTEKLETIKIGAKGFIKRNNGKWEVDDSTPKYGTAAASMPSVRMIEKTNFNGQEVSVYEEKYQMVSENRDSNVAVKYYFNKEGYLLKKELEEINDKTKEFSKTVTLYEYNPKDLKIEAPIK